MDFKVAALFGGVGKQALRTILSNSMVERLSRSRSEATQADEPIAIGRWYLVELAGEQFFQEAVLKCAPGQLVRLGHDHDNPWDESSIAVLLDRDRIGYIPAQSFVQPAIFDRGLAAFARIKAVDRREDDLLYVTLQLALLEPGDAEFLNRLYSAGDGAVIPHEGTPATEMARTVRRTWIDRLLGRNTHV